MNPNASSIQVWNGNKSTTRTELLGYVEQLNWTLLVRLTVTNCDCRRLDFKWGCVCLILKSDLIINKSNVYIPYKIILTCYSNLVFVQLWIKCKFKCFESQVALTHTNRWRRSVKLGDRSWFWIIVLNDCNLFLINVKTKLHRLKLLVGWKLLPITLSRYFLTIL